MIDVHIAHYDDSLIVWTIPLAIVSTQCLWITSIDNAHQSDRQAIAILIALVELRKGTLQDALLTHHAHTVLIVYHIALIIDSLLGQADAITPILEDEHTRVYR